MVDILLIAVNYCSDPTTVQYLRSLRGLCGVRQMDIRVILVDNTPRVHLSEFRREVVAAFPDVELLDTSRNLGYFGGARYALGCWLERTGQWPSWLIVSNVDLLFPDGTFLARLVSRYAGDSACGVGVIAPAVTDMSSGQEMNPFLRAPMPRWRLRIYRLLFRSYVAGNLYGLAGRIWRRLRARNRAAEGCGCSSSEPPVEIYAPHGSIMVFSQEYFRRGGGLDHVAFLFGEEIFVAETCRRLGLKVVYDPALRVLHQAHVSTSGLGGWRSRTIIRYQREALDALWQHFFVG